MDKNKIREDLDFLVTTPEKSLLSEYHDAGSAWLLIEAALEEIREMKHKNNRLRSALLYAADGFREAASEHECEHCAMAEDNARRAANKEGDE